MSGEFDAIVCGSGITGGWAAKELTERGLRVLLLERGPNLEHRKDYKTEFTPPWELPFRGYSDPKVLATTKRHQKGSRSNEWTHDMFVDDDVEIYSTTPESDFQWLRGYHLGGRSLMWARHCYRMGQLNFSSNAQDGHGVPWPVDYAEMSPWYDYVEEFIGVNGTTEQWPSIPDGHYQPTMGLNAGEQYFAKIIAEHYADRRLFPGRTANLTRPIGDRVACQNRDQCARGCSFGAYFSTQSSTLPAAQATGRLTLMTDALADSIDYDPLTRKARGVRVLNTRTGERSLRTAKLVFLCAGSVNSLGILLRSASEQTPGGLGNSSGLLGTHFMDHCFSGLIMATLPGMTDQMYTGRKPNGIFMPRYVNLQEQQTDFLRGYSFQGISMRANWTHGASRRGIGAGFKQSLRLPGPWMIGFAASIEHIPRKENRVSIRTDKTDHLGLPLMHFDVRWSDNEHKAAVHARRELQQMLRLAGGELVDDTGEIWAPGMSIHEMGGAPMGDDPGRSVTNRWNQLHDANNVFVTDGASMNSTGDRNPSLSYMAFTARAAAHAAELFKHDAV